MHWRATGSVLFGTSEKHNSAGEEITLIRFGCKITNKHPVTTGEKVNYNVYDRRGFWQRRKNTKIIYIYIKKKMDR